MKRITARNEQNWNIRKLKYLVTKKEVKRIRKNYLNESPKLNIVTDIEKFRKVVVEAKQKYLQIN